ncbi:MAG: tape measure protein [Armatimonadota bacterium]|nr:tape measure protein [bacterium]
MALKVGELFGTLGLDDSGWNSAIKSAHTSLQNIGSELKNLGGMLTVGVTLPLLGLGGAAIKVAGDMEQTRIALTTMLGSADKATAFIKDIQQFAAKTPFEFSGLIQNSKQLIAFGYEANDIIPIMTNLGNAVSSVGGNGETINRIIMQLGQMKSIGKASMEDIRPIAEAGVPVLRYLAQGLGKSQAEISKMISLGSLSAEAFMDGLMKGMSNDSKLKGMMDKQSKGLLGLWSNFKDWLFQTLEPLGEPLAKIGKNLLTAIQPIMAIVKRIAEGFAKLPTGVQALIIGFVGAVAAIGPLLVAVGSVISAITSIVAVAPAIGTAIGAAVAAASGPVGWIIAGVVAIGTALVLAYNKVKPFRDAVNQAWSSIKEAFSGLWESVKKLLSALSPVFNVMKKIWGAEAKVGLMAIGATLKIVGIIISGIVSAIALGIEKLIELIRKIGTAVLAILATIKPQARSLFETLATDEKNGFGDSLAGMLKRWQGAFKAFGSVGKATADERKRQLAEVAQAEIDSIMKVIEKQREQAEERRQQLRDAMGFKGVTELWHMAMEAGLKGSLGKAKESTEVTKANLPNAKELQDIRETLKRQEKNQTDLNSLVRERLGVVTGVG